MNPTLKMAASVALALSVVGCATSNNLYRWGGYEDNLYAAYKDPTRAEALRLKLEAHIQETEKAGLKVAPGLYAELGTLYMQAGSQRKAIDYYTLERKAWPESNQLMTAMIQNLERREGAKQTREAAR